MRLILCVLALLLLPLAARAAPAPDAEALLDRMLSALGGRTAWAAVQGTVNDSQQNRVDEPTVVRAVITMDFTRPRFRIDTTAPGLSVTRVINGGANSGKHWRRTRDGRIEAVPAELVAEDLLWYGAHVYRSIHRLAARDKALSVRLGENGQLEVLEGGARLIWFRLDAKGEPYSFGFRDAETGSVCGPWEFAEGGIKHPIWVSSADGTWRANAKAVVINPKIDDALLAKPAN